MTDNQIERALKALESLAASFESLAEKIPTVYVTLASPEDDELNIHARVNLSMGAQNFPLRVNVAEVPSAKTEAKH